MGDKSMKGVVGVLFCDGEVRRQRCRSELLGSGCSNAARGARMAFKGRRQARAANHRARMARELAECLKAGVCNGFVSLCIGVHRALSFSAPFAIMM